MHIPHGLIWGKPFDYIQGKQKGAIPILAIIILFAIIGLAGATGAALLGEAPQCPNETGAARLEKQLGDILEKGSVTINNTEATTLARGYVGSKISDLRVCFTGGLAHASGKLPLGNLTPSFYVSIGVDLQGATPKATNLNIKVGSLPDVPVLSDQVGKTLTDLINQNLGKFQMKEKYSVEFVAGSATIKKLAK